MNNTWPGVRRHAGAYHHHNHHQNALISMQITTVTVPTAAKSSIEKMQ